MYRKHLTGLLLVGLLLNISAGLPDDLSGAALTKADDVKQAQAGIIALIKSGQTESAGRSVDKLLIDYSQSSGLPEALYWIGRHYGWTSKYEEEKNIYQRLIQGHPANSYANKARLGFCRAEVQALIASQRFDEAKAAFDKLTVDFSSHPDLHDALYWIAWRYGWSNRYRESRDVFQRITRQYPASSKADEARMGAYRMNICLLIVSGQAKAAQSEFNKMTAEFSGHPDFAETLDIIALRWVWAGNYPAARSIYQQIMQNGPGSSYAEKAQAYFQITGKGIDIFSLVESGQVQEADGAIERLMKDFGGNDLLAQTIILCGERYFARASQERNSGSAAASKEDFARALGIFKKIIERLPACTTTPYAYYYSAVCYDELGEYEKAIECYKTIVEVYPDYYMAWNAQFMVGYDYKRMLKAGRISESQARPQIKAAYQKVLANYPDCKAVKLAKKWLGRNGN